MKTFRIKSVPAARTVIVMVLRFGDPRKNENNNTNNSVELRASIALYKSVNAHTIFQNRSFIFYPNVYWSFKSQHYTIPVSRAQLNPQKAEGQVVTSGDAHPDRP